MVSIVFCATHGGLYVLIRPFSCFDDGKGIVVFNLIITIKPKYESDSLQSIFCDFIMILPRFANVDRRKSRFLFPLMRMTSSDWKHCPRNWPFVTLWGEFIGHWWIPLTKVSDEELWSFLWSAPEETVEQKTETPVILAIMWRDVSCIFLWYKIKWMLSINFCTTNEAVCDYLTLLLFWQWKGNINAVCWCRSQEG